MPRLTFADIKASRICEALNIPPTDTRLASYVNEAIQRLLQKGRWWGTMAKYAFTATSGCITLPRQIATIEKVAQDNQVIDLHDFWYEFIDNGWGTRDSDSSGLEALFKGRFPIFSDIIPPGKRVRCLCDLASDVGKEVLILGYDDDNNWIRTTQSGVVADGELIALAQTPGTTSVNNFQVVTDIQAPATLNGQWWLYELDTATLVTRMIGQYQYDEVRPSFARYLFPAIGSTNALVEALVKLEFIPVKNDADYSLIGNLAALKKECMAVKAEEENRFQDAVALEAMAVKLLDEELDHYLGAGRNLGINIISQSITSNDPVATFL